MTQRYSLEQVPMGWFARACDYRLATIGKTRDEAANRMDRLLSLMETLRLRRAYATGAAQ